MSGAPPLPPTAYAQHPQQAPPRVLSHATPSRRSSGGSAPSPHHQGIPPAALQDAHVLLTATREGLKSIYDGLSATIARDLMSKANMLAGERAQNATIERDYRALYVLALNQKRDLRVAEGEVAVLRASRRGNNSEQLDAALAAVHAREKQLWDAIDEVTNRCTCGHARAVFAPLISLPHPQRDANAAAMHALQQQQQQQQHPQMQPQQQQQVQQQPHMQQQPQLQQQQPYPARVPSASGSAVGSAVSSPIAGSFPSLPAQGRRPPHYISEALPPAPNSVVPTQYPHTQRGSYQPRRESQPVTPVQQPTLVPPPTMAQHPTSVQIRPAPAQPIHPMDSSPPPIPQVIQQLAQHSDHLLQQHQRQQQQQQPPPAPVIHPADATPPPMAPEVIQHLAQHRKNIEERAPRRASQPQPQPAPPPPLPAAPAEYVWSAPARIALKEYAAPESRLNFALYRRAADLGILVQGALPPKPTIPADGPLDRGLAALQADTLRHLASVPEPLRAVVAGARGCAGGDELRELSPAQRQAIAALLAALCQPPHVVPAGAPEAAPPTPELTHPGPRASTSASGSMSPPAAEAASRRRARSDSGIDMSEAHPAPGTGAPEAAPAGGEPRPRAAKRARTGDAVTVIDVDADDAHADGSNTGLARGALARRSAPPAGGGNVSGWPGADEPPETPMTASTFAPEPPETPLPPDTPGFAPAPPDTPMSALVEAPAPPPPASAPPAAAALVPPPSAKATTVGRSPFAPPPPVAAVGRSPFAPPEKPAVVGSPSVFVAPVAPPVVPPAAPAAVVESVGMEKEAEAGKDVGAGEGDVVMRESPEPMRQTETETAPPQPAQHQTHPLPAQQPPPPAIQPQPMHTDPPPALQPPPLQPSSSSQSQPELQALQSNGAFATLEDARLAQVRAEQAARENAQTPQTHANAQARAAPIPLAPPPSAPLPSAPPGLNALTPPPAPRELEDLPQPSGLEGGAGSEEPVTALRPDQLILGYAEEEGVWACRLCQHRATEDSEVVVPTFPRAADETMPGVEATAMIMTAHLAAVHEGTYMFFAGLGPEAARAELLEMTAEEDEEGEEEGEA